MGARVLGLCRRVTAYYNENDAFAAAWLRELIGAGHIAPGDVDERSIEDVQPSDLRGYTQHHFFAGIGVWSYALRLAGWPDDRPIWTGSCPCQPFSAAGKRAATADRRHLWPAWFRLVRECRPDTLVGEQVEGAVRLGWLDLVFGDLEGEGYACGAVVFGAHSVGAPHIRQRLYWMADAARDGRRERRALKRRRDQGSDANEGTGPLHGSASLGLADADDTRSQGRNIGGDGPGERAVGPDGMAGGMGDADIAGFGGSPVHLRERRQEPTPPDTGGAGDDRWSRATAGFWRDPDWLLCRDGRWRPVEARIQQMVDGIALRVGHLRADLAVQTEEILNEAARRLQTEAGEILRAVRDEIGSSEIFSWTGGRLQSVHEAQILLSYLLEYAGPKWQKPDAAHGSGAGVSQNDARMLWRKGTSGDPSRKRGLDGWPLGELADSLRFLSHAVARSAQEAGYPVLYADAPASFPLSQDLHEDSLGRLRSKNRVGRLRGYGNAIVAPQAAAFIAAVKSLLSPDEIPAPGDAAC